MFYKNKRLLLLRMIFQSVVQLWFAAHLWSRNLCSLLSLTQKIEDNGNWNEEDAWHFGHRNVSVMTISRPVLHYWLISFYTTGIISLKTYANITWLSLYKVKSKANGPDFCFGRYSFFLFFIYKTRMYAIQSLDTTGLFIWLVNKIFTAASTDGLISIMIDWFILIDWLIGWIND